MVPPGPGGPWGVFSAYFRSILNNFWPIFPPISPLGALFLGPLLALSGLLCCGEYPRRIFLPRNYGNYHLMTQCHIYAHHLALHTFVASVQVLGARGTGLGQEESQRRPRFHGIDCEPV